MDEASASRKRRADSDDEEYWKQVTAESKKKRATAAEGLKRTASDRLKEEGATSSESDKKKKLLCLNLISAGGNSLHQQKALEQIEMDNPLFVITSCNQTQYIRNRICKDQCSNMKYFIHLDGSYIYSNSVAVIAELTMKNLACSIPESSQQHYAMARINCEAESKMFEDALNQAMRNQQKTNENILFLCSVIQELPSEEGIQSAHESSAQRHEPTNELDLEAWGDVNNCKLDPVKVRKAREEEMEYFRRMQVYRKVPI